MGDAFVCLASHLRGNERNRMTDCESARPASVIAVRRAGILAREICECGGGASVAAVFARSLYLRVGADFLCVGEEAIGNGPLTLIADVGVPALGLRAGMPALISPRAILIGGALRLSLERSATWRPPAWPAAASPASLAATCAALAARAAREAPPDGLARIVAGVPHAAPTPSTRLADERVAAFQLWLGAELKRSALASMRRARHVPPPVNGLIGLGPGLTPSGDDFLCGALATLDALGECGARAALADAVRREASALTSPLSACLLRAAAAGHFGDRLHRAACDAITGRAEAAAAALAGIGHSSGWDMLAGIVATLRAVAQRHNPHSFELMSAPPAGDRPRRGRRSASRRP